MTGDRSRVVGLDGGATHTRYLLADGEGRVLATTTSGSSLLGAAEDAEVAERMIAAVGELLGSVNEAPPVDVLCAGLAGAAGRPAARAYVERRLGESGVARKVSLVTDSEVAFRDAFGDGDGILIIAGTGSVAVGRVGDEPLRRVGGWGRLIGDEGSGYLLGLAGVRAAVRGAESRGPATGLTLALYQVLDVSTVQRIFEWSETAKKADIAAFAPRVVEQADKGDAVAGRIVTGTVEALVKHATALWGETPEGVTRPSVALVGGLVEPGGILRERVGAALAAAGFQVLSDSVNPARGAVRMALSMA